MDHKEKGGGGDRRDLSGSTTNLTQIIQRLI